MTVHAQGNAKAEAGTTAVSCVELTNVVVNGVGSPVELRKYAVAPFRKPEPVIVRVKDGLPEFAVVGESDVRVGGGFKTVTVTPGTVRGA